MARRVIGIARRKGARDLWLIGGETNRPAISLYRKLWFEQTAVKGLEEGLEDEALNTGKRRVTMVKRLLNE